MAAATPTTNRLKLAPSNSPSPLRTPRSSQRGRAPPESRLLLKRVIGTTCSSPSGLDTVNSLFAYIAGGAVVVANVDGDRCTQRFYRARPTAVPLYSVTSGANTPSSPSTTPKANDSRGRVPSYRDSRGSPGDWGDSGSQTWTSRERIKAATCVALSRDGKYLAVGETGYAPRVLIFSLMDASSDAPLVSISEHTFGVNAVAWSPDTKWLASLGAANDGYLYVWKVDPRSGAAKLFQQNRCTSYVKDMVWMKNNLITLGVRHVKMWKVEEGPMISPTRQKFLSDSTTASQTQKTLPGRNIILGSMLEATFTCAAVVNDSGLIVCSEVGDVCILVEEERQLKLLKVLSLGFSITSIEVNEAVEVVYVGGKEGNFATLDIKELLDCKETCVLNTSQNTNGLVAMGIVANKLVTIDSNQSIDIFNADHNSKNDSTTMACVPIPGNGESVIGIQPLQRSNEMNAAFLTWSNSGIVAFWDLEGQVKNSIGVPLEVVEPEGEVIQANQLTFARATDNGKLLVAVDRLGVLRVMDLGTKECLVDMKAHSSECRFVSTFEHDGKFLMGSCGRDRTTQLFHRRSDGTIEHFQTLESVAKVVQVIIPSVDRVVTCAYDRTLQVYDLVSKEGDPDALAAIPSRLISLKASPTSMVMGSDYKTIFVSLMDRSIYQFDLNTGRQISFFKCVDEGGAETAVLDSLSVGHWAPKDQDFLLGTSNTDKSIRLYDVEAGTFLDREWGHTEAINGVCLVEDEDDNRKVVSVGSDGTIMIWALDLNDPPPPSLSRDPSPMKEGPSVRRPLRKVLSKAELAEFQRPSQGSGRKSPPRSVQRRTSRNNLASNAARTPTAPSTGPRGNAEVETPSRRPLGDDRTSPPSSPQSKKTKRPSMAASGHSVRKKTSSTGLRGFGTLNTSTEQVCRTLRTYRRKLATSEPISPDALSELDQELRLTAASLGERAIRSKAMNETVLSGLLDQYSERLITLLDEKLRLTHQPAKDGDEDVDEDGDSPDEGSSTSADGDTSSLSG